MANPVLQLLITAKDEASKSLGKISHALSSLGGLVLSVTRSALNLVFPDFGDSVKAAESLEIQMGKLRAGIEATGGTAGLTAEEIDAMARRLDEATLGSAEGFRNAAIELLTFKSVGVDSFERTLKAAQDLADAGFGTVEKATVQLGKALEDPTKGLTSLTRVGVSFTAEQKNMIENFVRLGKTAQAQNIILAAVEGQVQGIASAAGGGLAGAVDLVGKRMTDLKETVGGVLTPILTQLNLVWADVIGSVQSAAAEIAGPLVSGTKAGAGALKALGEGIGKFLGDAIRDLGVWIKTLDWQNLQDGASQANAKLNELIAGFREFGTVAEKIMDGVSVGVNTVQVAFGGIVSGVQSLVSGFISGLASVEAAAAKVGLGSLERATELQARAEEWKQYAADSIAAVKKNAAEGVDAFTHLVGVTDDAAAAQKNLKDALPVDELQTLTKTLDDYRGIAERANTVSQQAKIDFDAGKVSAADYGAKLLDAALANQELKQQTEAALKAESKRTATLKDSTEQMAEGVALFEKNAAAAKSYADGVEGVVNAQLEGVKAEIALAEAKGDTATAQQLTSELAILEAEGSLRVAKAKQAEQEMEYALAVAKRNQTAALVKKNEATQEDLTLTELVVEKELAEAQAAGVNTQAQEILAQKIREVNAAKGGGTKPTQENTQATRENSEAQRENAEASDTAAESAGGLAQTISSMIDYWRQHTASLSESTKALFELKAGLSKGVDTSLFAGLSDEAITATKEIENANQAIGVFNKQILFSTGSVGKFMDEVQRAGYIATKSYYEQKLAAEALEVALVKAGDGAITRFGTAAAAIRGMTDQTEVAINGFNLLNDQDIAKLRSALDDANNKLQQMQEEAQSAKDRLAELNAELLEAQGADEKAELLRQQLDYQQSLAEIERQRNEAELQGNRDLITVLNQQQAILEKINKTKIANIQADADQQTTPSSTKNTTSESISNSSTPTKKYQLDLTAGTQTLSALTDIDPQSFLDALTRAKRSAT